MVIMLPLTTARRWQFRRLQFRGPIGALRAWRYREWDPAHNRAEKGLAVTKARGSSNMEERIPVGTIGKKKSSASLASPTGSLLVACT